MTQTTLTLADFLLARVAEDEAVGRACEPECERHPYGDRTLPSTPFAQLGDDLRGYLGGPLGDHAAHWHPARVLAECEAKRKIVGLWNLQLTVPEPEYGLAGGEPLGGQGAEVYYDALKALALPYAGHPDYRDEWRP